MIAVVLMFGGLILFLALGMQLAFALGILATIFGYFTMGPGIFATFSSRAFDLMSNYILIAGVLFVFMAYLLVEAEVAEKLYTGFRYLFGPINGGLAVATVVVCTLFAASTGIIGASVVSMSLLALPAMLRYNYSPVLATGTVATAGCLGILIAPSVMLIVYGSLTSLSVGKLFAASIFPGLTLSFLYISYIVVVCARKPELGPGMSLQERAEISLGRRLLKALTGVGPVLILILGVLGTIFVGLATPTEASAIGAFIAFLMMVAYGKFSVGKLKKIVFSSLKTVGMVYFILLWASCFTTVFLGMGGGKVVTNFVLGMGGGPMGSLILMMLVVFILGMLLDWIGIVMIVVPLFQPIAESLGFNGLWFALLVCICLQTSFITPPFAYAIFYLLGTAPKGVEINHIYKGVFPFIILQIIGLALCIMFPQIILWLPNKIIS